MYMLYQRYASRVRSAGGQQVVPLVHPNSTAHHGALESKTGNEPAQRMPRQQTTTSSRDVFIRRRLVADGQIISCVILCGLLIIGAGVAMFLVAWFLLGRDDPFMLIGPVFAGSGVIVLLLSVEVCVRRTKIAKIAEDLSSDDEDHYMDDDLVQYGYGNYGGSGQAASVPKKTPILVQTRDGSGLAQQQKLARKAAENNRGGKGPKSPAISRDEDMLEVSMTQDHIELLLSPNSYGKN